MAAKYSDKEENYARIVFTLMKGGTKLTCRLFEKRVADLKPADHGPNPWTIYDFLLANKKHINTCKQSTGRERERLLFPDEPDKIKHATWDLYLLCFLLRELCKLSSSLNVDLDILKNIRNKVCHTSEPALSDEIYEVHKEQILVVFDRLMKAIGGDDEDFIKEIDEIQEQLKGAPLNFAGAIQEIYQLLQTTKDIKTGVDNLNATVPVLAKKIDMIMDHLHIDRHNIKVEDIPVKINPTNCDRKTKKDVSQKIVKKMKLAIHKDDTEETTSEQTSAVSEPDAGVEEAAGEICEHLKSSGKQVVGADLKCVMLTLRCTSIDALFDLYQDSITGNLNNMFKPLEAALNEIEGFEKIRLQVTVDEEELVSVITNYVDAIVKSERDLHTYLEENIQTQSAPKTELRKDFENIQRELQPVENVTVNNNQHNLSVKDTQIHVGVEHELRAFATKKATKVPDEQPICHSDEEYFVFSGGIVTIKDTEKDIFEMSSNSRNNRYESLPIFGNPVRFISISEDGQFDIDENTFKQIREIELPIVVVAIVGLCGTGKSYLLNCLAEQPRGFPLGTSFEAKTDGIWAWCKMHPTKSDTVVLMLDSQGLGDVQKGDTTLDYKVCTLLALCCNVFVYNMMSALNKDFVEDLTFVSEIARRIYNRNKEIHSAEENSKEILPTLVICLRDFYLILDKGGKQLNADEYLEECLRLKSGEEDGVQRYNQTRECIKKYFPKRKCFTFDIPGDAQTLKRLDSIPFEELSDDFRKDVQQFRLFVNDCEHMVLQQRKPVDGQGFTQLVSTYVDAIRDGEVPNIDDAVTAVSKMKNEKMENAAIEDFRCSLEKVQLPILKSKEFDYTYRKLKDAAMSYFRMDMDHASEFYMKRAVNVLEKLWKAKEVDNKKSVRTYCHQQLQGMYDRTIRKKLINNKYNTDAGYDSYRCDINELKVMYLLKMEGICEYEVKHVLAVFIENETVTEHERYVERISEERKKDELQKLKEKLNDIERELAYAFDMEKRKMERYIKALELERDEYMKNQEKMIKEFQNVITNYEAVFFELKEDNMKEITKYQNKLKQMKEEFTKDCKDSVNEAREKQ